LEGDRLRALARVRMEVAADEAPWEERPELELESPAVVVAAADREHVDVSVLRLDRRRRAADGNEDNRLDPGGRRSGGDRVAEVAGRRAAQRRDAVVEGRGHGERRGPVLVRPGRVLALELEPQVELELLGE